ncbi:MAG: GGDEF domain-containing protein [Candidatus Limnocylindrales bacterium]
MSVTQLQLLLALALGANVLLLLVLVVPSLIGRSLPGGDDPELVVRPDPGEIALQVAAAQGDAPPEVGGVSRLTYEAAVRLVSYGYLATVAVAVTLSGAWPTTSGAIYLVLGTAVLFVVVVHDLLPRRVLGPGKYVLEGIGAIAVVTLLVALTGGATSPFVVGYFLIAAAAALMVDARTNFLLAAGISILYLVTIWLVQGSTALGALDVARLVAGLAAFWLISYLASVVARSQRLTRDAAIRLSLHDPLTRLFNRAYVMAVLEREIQRARRTGRGFCVLALDLDGLKPINDTFGHPMGDRVLRAVGEVIGSRIRGIDTGGRVGGDEFLVLLPETDELGAVILAEQLRDGVNEIRIDADTWLVRTSISVGIASFPIDGATASELLERADMAMYASKRGGRDRVRVAHGIRPTVLSTVPVPVAATIPVPVVQPIPVPAAPPTPAVTPVMAPPERPLARVRAARGAWRLAPPATGPVFGGRRADTVAAALAWPPRSALGAAELVGHATRAAATVAPPTVAAPKPTVRAAARRGADRDAAAQPLRADERSATPLPRPRRFRVTQQDDEAQFRRTMRQFLSGPDEPRGPREASDPPR